MKVDVAHALWEKASVVLRGAFPVIAAVLLAPAVTRADDAPSPTAPSPTATGNAAAPAQPAPATPALATAAPAAGQSAGGGKPAETEPPQDPPKPTAAIRRPGAPSWERPILPGEGRPVPDARDDRGGHFFIRPEGGLMIPLGRLHTGLASGDVVATGIVGGGSIGVGLSRYAELFARGGYGVLGSATGCDECDARVGFANLGFRYHLAQGVALDPTIGFAMGYRNMTIEGLDQRIGDLGPDDMGDYHGFDIATASLGAMYFPVRGFGFGPELSATLGTFLSRPRTDTDTSTSAYFMMHLALSVELDPIAWFQSTEPLPPKPRITTEITPPSF